MIQWEYNMQKLPFDEHLVRRLNDIGEDGWECILVKYDTNLLIKRNMITNPVDMSKDYLTPNPLNLVFEHIYFVNSKEYPNYQLNHYFYQNRLNIQIIDFCGKKPRTGKKPKT